MTDTSSTSFDHTVDVLLVGSGAGAMTAALRAHDQGGRTLLIEKTGQYGGSSAMSSCLLWIPNNHLMADAGVPDTPEEAWSYLKGTTAGTVSDDRLRAFLETSPEALKYLDDSTRAEFVSLPEYSDYYPRVQGSKPGGRSVEPQHFDGRQLGDDFLNLRDQSPQMQVMGRLGMTAVEARMTMTGQPGGMMLFLKLCLKYAFDLRWRLRSKRDRNPSGGNALIGMLRLSLMDRDVPLWLNTPARELIVEDGRVTGVVIEMGKAIGAGLDLMDDAWWGPTTVVPGEDLARFLVIEKSLPRSILVNKVGERFTNEAAPYTDIVNAMYERDSPETPCVPAYFVFDATYRKNYMCGPLLQGSAQPDWMVRKLFKQGYLKRAKTLDDLAVQLGVDAEGLKKSVAKNNEYARTGKDPEFERGETIYDRYYGDAKVEPNPCLGPIEEAPFYAIEVFPGELGTKGGLTVDARARVTSEAGEVIPGLYAVGNCAASVMGRSYPGAGATIGPATTFGYIAATDAMGS